jgi:hypothetical protein
VNTIYCIGCKAVLPSGATVCPACNLPQGQQAILAAQSYLAQKATCAPADVWCLFAAFLGLTGALVLLRYAHPVVALVWLAVAQPGWTALFVLSCRQGGKVWNWASLPLAGMSATIAVSLVSAVGLGAASAKLLEGVRDLWPG